MGSTELKAGKMVIFSQGEYSDYCYMGAFVALKDLSENQLRKMVEPLKKGEYQDNLDEVVALLIREGFLLELDYTEIHVGSYSTIDL